MKLLNEDINKMENLLNQKEKENQQWKGNMKTKLLIIMHGK